MRTHLPETELPGVAPGKPDRVDDPVRVYVCYDVERDSGLYAQLASECEAPDIGFTLTGGSARFASTDAWNEDVRQAIRDADQVIVICSERTDESMTVSMEFRIALEERKPYLLLWGRRECMCTKPAGAAPERGIYSWSLSVLQQQLAQMRRAGRRSAASDDRSTPAPAT